jgi:thiamine biosynthesis lipoprotein
MKTNDGRSGSAVGRREFLAFGAGVFVVASIPVAMYRRAAHPQLIRRSIPVMGTIAEVGVVHRDAATAHAAIDAAFDELRWVERTMTRFTDTSDIGRANLASARNAVGVDPATAMVVSEALRWAAASNGAYDPAVGRTVALWDVQNRHEPPLAGETRRFARRSLYHAVELGQSHGAPVLVYHEPDVALDLGAIAKGYAVDRATAALRDRGIAKGIVMAGGDLYALGTASDDEPWTVGIRDPQDTRATVGELRVSDAAVATSGTYYRFFRYRGVRYHHLMDPDIAAPRRTSVQSLTIRADSCMHADVATTTLFGMDTALASRLLARMAPGARVEAVLI